MPRPRRAASRPATTTGDGEPRWSRREARCFHLDQLPVTGAGDPVAVPPLLEGATARLVSHDPDSGAVTWLAELPAGYRHKDPAADATVELFLLEGDIALDGDRAGAGGYVCLPQGCGGGKLASKGGARALVFWNPALPSFPEPYHAKRIVRTWQIPLQVRTPGSVGQLYRPLRLPDTVGETFNGGPGGFLRMTVITPGMTSPSQHLHRTCWEEGFVLSGDIFVGERGLMGPGSYIAFPQGLWHAVLASQTGCVLLVHTDAPMDFPWELRDHPAGPAMVEDYMDAQPWGRPATHVPWDETPQRRFLDSPAVRAWAKKAPVWEPDVERGSASRFRGSWRRSRDS